MEKYDYKTYKKLKCHGYLPLEFISKERGSDAYINTGITPSPNWVYEIFWSFGLNSASFVAPFYSIDNDKRFQLRFTSNNLLQLWGFSSDHTNKQATWIQDADGSKFLTRIEFNYQDDKIRVINTLYAEDGESVTETYTDIFDKYASQFSAPLLLLSNIYSEVYNVRIFDANNYLIHDYMPMFSKNLNKSGVYDLTTDTFLHSETESDFLKGDFVDVPNPAYNKRFFIYNEDGTPFHNLELKDVSYDSTVMSLSDKITGSLRWIDNGLELTMKEYIVYDDIKFFLVNPPTIVKEGLLKDNSELKGTAKYTFEFFHPMYMLSNFMFKDVAVSADEEQYKSQDKTFFWIGNLSDFVAKLNKNLQQTEWVVTINEDSTSLDKRNELSDVLSFDKVFISDALKTAYDTWEVPFVIDKLNEGELSYYDDNNQEIDYYSVGKRFKITFGLATEEIYETDEYGDYILDDEDEKIPFVFRFGQGLGLRNNSRSPKNNKIITRLSAYGSEENVPFGYPQIIWTGDQTWQFTINNSSGMQTITIDGVQVQAMSYPIYDGIVNGQRVKLINHPFTRKTIQPSIYAETVNKKVNPYAQGFNPNENIIDYHDADSSFPNPINPLSPSWETHGFDEIKPRFAEKHIIEARTYDLGTEVSYLSPNEFDDIIDDYIASSDIQGEIEQLTLLKGYFDNRETTSSAGGYRGNSYRYKYTISNDEYFFYVTYESTNINFTKKILVASSAPDPAWNDDIDDEGNYIQKTFKIKLPALGFDLYACAALTQSMSINMRSGACIGCTFNVMVDWDAYKTNFYDEEGKFTPSGQGSRRNFDLFPDSTNNEITIFVEKDTSTFGTIMPNVYQRIKGDASEGVNNGDKFVILGISMPSIYVTNAQTELDSAMDEYLLENNVYYHEYPLKFDEFFFAKNEFIFTQISNNKAIRFIFGNEPQKKLYIKQISIKYGKTPLPEYNISLTDDVDVVLNQIGQTTEDVSRVRLSLSELHKYYSSDKTYSDIEFVTIANELQKLIANKENRIIRTFNTYHPARIAEVEGRGECIVYDLYYDGDINRRILTLDRFQMAEVRVGGVTRDGVLITNLSSIQNMQVVVHYMKNDGDNTTEHYDAIIARSAMYLSGGREWATLNHVYGRSILFYWSIFDNQTGANQGYAFGLGDGSPLVQETTETDGYVYLNDEQPAYTINDNTEQNFTISNMTSSNIDYNETVIYEPSGVVYLDVLNEDKTFTMIIDNTKGCQIRDLTTSPYTDYKFENNNTLFLSYDDNDQIWQVLLANKPHEKADYHNVVADNVLSSSNAVHVPTISYYAIRTDSFVTGDYLFLKTAVGGIQPGFYFKQFGYAANNTYVSILKPLATLSDMSFVRSTDAITESGFWTITNGVITKIESGSSPTDIENTLTRESIVDSTGDIHPNFSLYDIWIYNIELNAPTLYDGVTFTPSVASDSNHAKVRHLIIRNYLQTDVVITSNSVFYEEFTIPSNKELEINIIFVGDQGEFDYTHLVKDM